MSSFKKYPLFTAVLALLLVAFLAGAGWNIYLNSNLQKETKTLKQATERYNNARNADPSEEQLEISGKNLKILDQKLDYLIKDLSRAEGDILKPLPFKESYEFVEGVRGIVGKWKSLCKSKDIKLADGMEFSMKRYTQVGATAEKEAVAPLWKQLNVLDFILQKLFKSKPEGMDMIIVSVQRESLPEEGVKATDARGRRAVNAAQQRVDKGEIFEMPQQISAKIPGSIDTLAYKFEIVGHTEVLRLFLNQLKDFDAMLVVRSVEVVPEENESSYIAAAEGDVSASFDAFAALGVNFADSGSEGALNPDGTTQDSGNIPVVTNNTSKFTVIIEYLEVIKDSPAADGKKGAKSKKDDDDE